MTRIIGGVLGSLRLKGPAKATRPTSDRVKESLFSILESMDAIEGADVLDLFAGTGALGLESASRGAKSVVLVEKDREAAGVCKHNIELVRSGLKSAGMEPHLSLTTSTAASYLRSTKSLDLVFIDPPYDLNADAVFDLLVQLSPHQECLVVLERSGREKLGKLPPRVSLVKEVRYGDSRVFFLTTGDAQ